MKLLQKQNDTYQKLDRMRTIFEVDFENKGQSQASDGLLERASLLPKSIDIKEIVGLRSILWPNFVNFVDDFTLLGFSHKLLFYENGRETGEDSR